MVHVIWQLKTTATLRGFIIYNSRTRLMIIYVEITTWIFGRIIRFLTFFKNVRPLIASSPLSPSHSGIITMQKVATPFSKLLKHIFKLFSFSTTSNMTASLTTWPVWTTYWVVWAARIAPKIANLNITPVYIPLIAPTMSSVANFKTYCWLPAHTRPRRLSILMIKFFN